MKQTFLEVSVLMPIKNMWCAWQRSLFLEDLSISTKISF